MATIHPFRALRSLPSCVEEVACPPYDVIGTEEARRLAEGKPRSFLRVIRPEINFPPGIDEHDDTVYQSGADMLARLAASGAFVVDEIPGLYVYRLEMAGRTQTGLFACVETRDYDEGRIVRHENTRPDKETDRTLHILAQRAHAEPVMLAYRSTEALDHLFRAVVDAAPLFDFRAEDLVRHTLWAVPDPRAFVLEFRGVDFLYVADGHHRCAAASRAARAEGGDPGERARFPAVLFPMEQMRILPYHRVIRRVPDGLEALLHAVAARFPMRTQAEPQPTHPGDVSLYAGGTWRTFTLPPSARSGVAVQLDVARLSEYLLEPLLGILDVRTDPNVAFVGGIRGTGELERLVDSGEASLAIAMYPTTMEQLMAVSDAGELMPPKSTWFEPKLRSGLLVHRF